MTKDWIEQCADLVQGRDSEGPEHVIKAGVSPSGVPHIGHANEIIRASLVAQELYHRGENVSVVITSDDADPLTSVPSTLATLDWELIDIGDIDGGILGRNLHRPLHEIPDPFDCCESYGEHQTNLLRRMVNDDLNLSPSPEFVRMSEVYDEGWMRDHIDTCLHNLDEAREIMSRHQDNIDEDWYPFNPKCRVCGKIGGQILEVMGHGTFKYNCEHCDHAGFGTYEEGKLPWRFEWPAQWDILDVDFEPFGKDHAEGSWPSGVEISREMYDNEPPTPLRYEWISFEGGPLSSSEGNIVTVNELMEFMEADELINWFRLNPERARDFSIEEIDQYVDMFDERNERSLLPYRFAAMLSMFPSESERKSRAFDEGFEYSYTRVENAGRWASHCDNQWNYSLVENIDDLDQDPHEKFDRDMARALRTVAGFVDSSMDGDQIQQGVYDTALEEGVGTGNLFSASYWLLLGREEGPPLGPFVAGLDRSWVAQRLRMEA